MLEPTGFEPSKLYNSRYQPRGLQTTIFGAADAIHSTGFSWDEILEKVSPDHVGTYSSSAFGQMQSEGLGGMLQNRLNGDRVTRDSLSDRSDSCDHRSPAEPRQLPMGHTLREVTHCEKSRPDIC